jgi:hypothetical protein
MNYHARAQSLANAYRLSIINRGDNLDLVRLIADEFKVVARLARAEGREREREKIKNENITP